jgi:hypothetical protein
MGINSEKYSVGRGVKMRASVIFLGFFLICLCTFAQADESARGMIRSGKADGLVVDILDVTNGNETKVSPLSEFRAGQEIRLGITSSLSGKVYLINVTPSGERRLLFPKTGENGSITKGQRMIFPPLNEPALGFDAEKGVETLEIAISPGEIESFEKAKDSQTPLAPANEVGVETGGNPGFEPVAAVRGMVRTHNDGVTFGKDKLKLGSAVRIILKLKHI